MKQRGRYDENPYLNSIVYEVEFDDGNVREYSANIIAENMLSQVDDEGFARIMMEAIVDYQKDEANNNNNQRFYGLESFYCDSEVRKVCLFAERTEAESGDDERLEATCQMG